LLQGTPAALASIETGARLALGALRVHAQVEQCDESSGDFGMTLGVGTRVSAGGQEGIRSLGYLYTHRCSAAHG
jgi:hypothetical protein